MTGLTSTLRGAGPLHLSLLLVTVTAAGLLLAADYPGKRYWLARVYSLTVIAASASCLTIMLIEIEQLDLRGGGVLGLTALVLAVAARRRYAAIVARRDALLDQLRHRQSGPPP